MTSQNLAAIIIKAKSGNVDALAALVDAIARDLRAFIATYATSQVMVEETHAATWIQVRRELNSCPSSSQAITWIRQRAITILRQQLDSECHAAIASRDGLRHLIAQDGIEGLQALVSPSNEGAALINQRYAALDEDSQTLVCRRYSDNATLSTLASENQCSDGEIAQRLFSIRAGMHWRATTSDQPPSNDQQLAIAIDQLLTNTLDGIQKQTLNATLMKDLGRAAAFARQARIDLMLRAIFAPYTQEQTRQIAGNLAKIENKRHNESSLLQVAAPPRSPIGSGSELRNSNERVANRKTDPPSSALVNAITMPTSRVGKSRRTASSDSTLLSRERPSPKNNQPSLFIGIGVAVIGLIALIILWNGNRAVIKIDGTTAGNHSTESVIKETHAPPNPTGGPRTTNTEPVLTSHNKFIRGINLGGQAVTIDRNLWLSHRDALSAGCTLGAGTNIAPPLAITGAGLDFDRKSMLDTGITSVSGGTIRLNQIMPNGIYGLTLWLANTSSLNEKQCDVSVNSVSINLSGAFSKHENWAQLGPMSIQVTNGKMELQISGHGNARMTGLELTAPSAASVSLPAAITLTSPVDAALFSVKETITFRVDVIGTVKSVAIFDGERRLGESTSKPYSVTVDSLPVGDHRVIARATNLSGETSESLPLAFSVFPENSTGTITMERWDGLAGNLISDALGQAKCAGPADVTSRLTNFTTNENLNNFYVRIRGYLLPPTTGNYVFFITSDDEGELLLSSDASPEHARRIDHGFLSGGVNDWSRYANEEPKPISLIAGQRYYIEMRIKNGLAPGYGACGWKLPNGTLERPIPGHRLIPFNP
jgi:DNA-directed RNA polymerase specialized sigma24 family protein